MAPKLPQRFWREFSGVVWRVQPDVRGEWLTLAIRQEALHEVTWYGVHVLQGQWGWEGWVLEEPWWVDLAGWPAHCLLVYRYDDPQDPTARTLQGVNPKTGQVLWAAQGLLLEQVGQQQGCGWLYAAEGERQWVYIDWETGRLQPEGPAENAAGTSPQPPPANLPPADTKGVQWPLHYREGEGHFDTVAQFVENFRGERPVLGCDYLEASGAIVISYYLYQAKGNYRNELLVLSTSGEPLHQEVLGNDLPGLGLDTFWVMHNVLVYVKEKCQICGYAIL